MMDHDADTMPAPTAVFGEEASALRHVSADGSALAIWTRTLPSAVAEAARRIDLDEVDDLSIDLALPATPAALSATLFASGYGEGEATCLAADMLELAGHMRLVTGHSHFRVRLEVVDTDACRRFHADYVTYRLLCTYAGQATQWVEADTPEDIRQLRAGEVGVFKGRLLLDEPTILHRSPPIASLGEQRLLLVIDTVSPDEQRRPRAPVC